MENCSDEILVYQTLRGDASAYASLIDRYKGAVHAIAYHKLGNFQDAEDVAQEAFLSAHQQLATLKEPSRFAGWLYCIVSNACKMLLRKRKKERELTVSLEDLSPTQAADQAYLTFEREKIHEQLRQAIDALSETDRLTLKLFYMGGTSCAEIGKLIGASENAVNNRLYHARKRLRKEMRDMINQFVKPTQLKASFTSQIMDTVQKTKLTSPKPQTPWHIPIGATVFLVLLVGLGVVPKTVSIPPFDWSAAEETIPVEMVFLPQVADSPVPIEPIVGPKPSDARLSDNRHIGQSNQGVVKNEDDDGEVENQIVLHSRTPEDTRLALELLREAWNLTEATSYYARESLLAEITKGDIDHALALAETIQDKNKLDWAYLKIISQQFKVDAAGTLPLLDKIQSPETKAWVIAQGAEILAKESPDKAKKLLLRAMEALKGVTVSETRLRIAILALRAARILGMAEIEQQLSTILPKTAMEVGKEAKEVKAWESDIVFTSPLGKDPGISEEISEQLEAIVHDAAEEIREVVEHADERLQIQFQLHASPHTEHTVQSAIPGEIMPNTYMTQAIVSAIEHTSDLGMLGIAAAALVESDFEAAFALITNRSEMKGIFRPLTDVIISLAEHDPRAAWRKLLEMRPLFERDNDFIGKVYLAKATKYIALALARTDVQLALDVARQMSSRVDAKAITLAKIASIVAEDDKQKALYIFEEASSVPDFMRFGSHPGRWATSARVGHMLSLVDKTRAKEFFSDLLQRLKTNPPQVSEKEQLMDQLHLDQQFEFVDIAFYMAEIYPDKARNLIEEVIAKANRAYPLREAAQAAIRIDVNWAIEIAKSIEPISENNLHAKAEALRKLAQYLLATPAERQTIHFGRWTATDAWSPGEETNW